MRVVWAWDNSVNHAFAIKGGYKLRVALLLASVRTWKKYYPEDDLILYCDIETYRIFQFKGFLKFWTKVKVVNFEKETQKWNLAATPCWGFPKLWTILDQHDPFIIVDADVYLTGPFKNSLSTEKLWAYWRYSMSDLGVSSVFKVDSRLKNIQAYAGNGSGECLHTCLVYFPEISFAKQYVNTVFSLDKELFELGCFDGKTRAYSGVMPWEYVMGADEETLNSMCRDQNVEVELVASQQIVHVEKKYGFTQQEYKKAVSSLLVIAELPENILGNITEREHEGVY